MLWSSTESSVSGWISTFEAVAVQHQPLDDGLKLIGPEDDLRVGDRMRSYRSVAEPAKLDLELLADDVTQPLGGRTRPGRIIVDMRVIAPIRDGVGGVGHGHAPCRPRYASEGRGTPTRAMSTRTIMTSIAIPFRPLSTCADRTANGSRWETRPP